ncbi:hypothetical protein [uncultured Shewanella sp.]|uniref:hypothetical protein n=1 Tax=uncultured Shewanella sp. TaxID=173975 RepID=UPI002619B255|nr:hypothetical protein [uncultured Shewanella sp.]
MTSIYQFIFHLLLLMNLQLFSFVLQAKDCQLPNSMNGLTMILSAGEEYSDIPPFENDVVEMTFSKKSYQGVGLKKNRHFIGEYVYRRLANNVAQVRTRELFGADILQYSLNLVCQSDFEGYYIYAPSSGETGPQLGILIDRYLIVQ